MMRFLSNPRHLAPLATLAFALLILARLPWTSSASGSFLEFAPVLQSPRCINCHTSVGFPRQGDDHHRHLFNVVRGETDKGAPGLRCSTCHIDRNQKTSGVPGAPKWGVAPIAMAWEGLTPSQLCKHLRGNATNGNRDLAALVDHMTRDPLVQWAWSPGSDPHGRMRSLPPASQAEFHAMVRRWGAAGGACPGEKAEQ